MKNILYVIGLIVLIAACTSSSSSVSGSAKTDELPTDSVMARASRWRLDSMGCRNIRSMNLAKSIIYELPENYKNCDSVRMLLGLPEGRSENKDYIELSYYHHSDCILGGDTAHPQWISFVFNTADKKFNNLSETAN